ncbi:MAG: hypothetical protein EBU90_11460 [Proteobacteria bacterium]|nr:hypothetical protein [Pseudomonadota bacterium]NBP14596.1 hypothetical protein [bacterium]
MRAIEFNRDLNPKLFADSKLRPEVRSKLISIANDFKNYCEIDFPVEDIQITGSQVSYHYTDESDLDLHLIVDYGKIQCDRELEELFDTKRHLYEREFNIRIRGIPVGLYVENQATPGISGGQYSVTKDMWIKQPKPFQGELDQESFAKHLSIWTQTIEKVLGQNDAKLAKKCLKSLRNYRKLGLKTTGEYGTENLVYKALRRLNILADLSDRVDQEHAKNLSIRL